jgi:HD-GYP domain-containing protein (c-di-GMP phosphodiesterase class II)
MTNKSELQADQLLNFSQILSSLSYALDLTSGYSMGHAQRTCLIGMRIAHELQLPEKSKTDLYFALLLKDSGCSSNAARMYEIFGGDEIRSKTLSRVTDWNNLAEVVKYVAAVSLPKHSLLARASRMLKVAAKSKGTTDELSHARCNRGAQIALSLGMGHGSAACIGSLEERWDGTGSPNHLQGDAIPLLSRIASVAQNLEVFWKTFDLEIAFDVINKRSGRWFDPELVKVVDSFRDDRLFWHRLSYDPASALREFECEAAVHQATDDRIDNVCSAFAEIVDAKSPFTGAHSFRVCKYSVEIAEDMGFEGARLTTLRRASLLHDVGKLGVSNAILDKPDKLDRDEWAAVRKHPYYSAQILGQIDGFARLAEIAGAHHERLDGKGYFQGLTAEQLDLDMRIVAVADVFDALAAKRPYRDAMPMDKVFAILDKDADVALDSSCIAALKTRYAPEFVTDCVFQQAA